MYPKAFIDRINNQFTDAEQFIDALTLPTTTAIRKHPIKGNVEELNLGEMIAWCKDAFYLHERPVFTLDPVFHAGAYYVQESSSMFIWSLLEKLFVEKDVCILDLCAAPGGKSTLIASWLNGEGLLVSNEVIKPRAQVLLENIIKWGYANTWVTSTDAYVLGGLDEFFDCVLLDAPCSGEGLFRKDKAAIDEWSMANCDLCASRQRKIVAEILPALNVGGYLIYSTCTYNPAENEENIAWMLKEFPLQVVNVDVKHHTEVTVTDEGGYAFYPHLTKGEGFYCCVLKKIGEVEPAKGVRRLKINVDAFDVKKQSMGNYVKHPEFFSWMQIQQKIVGVPSTLLKPFEQLSAITKILGGYLLIGEIKGKDLIPDQALAMSVYLNAPFKVIELNKKDALNYLARKDFKINNEAQGWCTVSYKDVALGFIKLLPNRFNNYYPVEWRIRMEV